MVQIIIGTAIIYIAVKIGKICMGVLNRQAEDPSIANTAVVDMTEKLGMTKLKILRGLVAIENKEENHE